MRGRKPTVCSPFSALDRLVAVGRSQHGPKKERRGKRGRKFPFSAVEDGNLITRVPRACFMSEIMSAVEVLFRSLPSSSLTNGCFLPPLRFALLETWSR